MAVHSKTDAANGKGSIVLAGFHAVGSRLRAQPQTIEVIYYDGQRRDARMQQLLAKAAETGTRCVSADATRLQGFSPEVPHQGVVAIAAAAKPEMEFDEVLDGVNSETFVLLLDGVTDPRNLGACMRTAAAAGVQAVIVPRDRSASLTAASAKAASGAVESVSLIAVTNLARAMRDMKDAGIWIVGADVSGEKDLFEVDLTGPRAWVLGAEGSGLRRLTRDNCDTLVRIPMAGGMESLNVSVATGVCLFETVRQRRALAA